MPVAALRPCAGRTGCPNRVTSGRCRDCASAYEQQRKRSETWRKAPGAHGALIDVYQTPRWKRERLEFLAEHPLCIDCETEGRVVAATVVDHEIPHRGNPVLMWDRANWRARCKPHHDQKTAGEVNARRSDR